MGDVRAGEELAASAEDFAAVDWQAPVAEATRKVDSRDLANLYRRRLPEVADEVRTTPEGRVFRLLFDLCGIALTAKDRGGVWGPLLVMNGEGRSAIPEDYSATQWAVMANLAPSVANPGLRARLADLVWSGDRRQRALADLAVDAYCDMVEGQRDGRYDGYLGREDAVDFDDVGYVHRALQISASTQKGRRPAARPTALAIDLFEAARAARAFVVFVKMARVLLRFELMDPAMIGAAAEEVVAPPTPAPFEMAVQGVWQFAAEAYRHAQKPEEARRCELQAVEFTLARARGAPSAFVASHFLRAAIAALRTISDTYETRMALERELRERQRQAIGEMKGSWHSTDLTEMAQAYLAAHKRLDLSDALLHFAFLDTLVEPVEQEAAARKVLREHPLAGLFGAQHHDSDGKVIAQHPGGSLGEPTTDTLQAKMREHAHHRRTVASTGAIGPVRRFMGARFSVGEQDLWPIVTQSPFVPPEHAAIFALGFTRFFQGDLMSATHLLLSQIEPALRHVLRSAGHEPSMIQTDMTQEDRSLSSLLEHDRPAIEAVFGTALTHAIDQIFNQKPPGLRHAMAHGQISSGACFGDEAIYAMWFIYHLTCAPLADHWATHVRPNLRLAGRFDSEQDANAGEDEGAEVAGLAEGDAVAETCADDAVDVSNAG